MLAFAPKSAPSSRREVAYSQEFRRIENIPRRAFHWRDTPGLNESRALLKTLYGAPDSPYDLRDIQVASICEALERQGGFFPASVGAGKTWITMLIPVVCMAVRPVLFVPADLRDKTLIKELPKMLRYWTLHPNLKIMSYDELSREKRVNFLFEYQPDWIIGDEIQALANPDAARTRRVDRYFKAFPETRFVGTSGTIVDKSLSDYAHIARWALKGNTPLPSKPIELEEWSAALDEEVDEAAVVMPGALIRFCENGENPRQGYRRRLTDTPGVIASGEEELGVGLTINEVRIPVPKAINDLMNRVRFDWEDPNGDIIMEATKKASLLRQMALGFWLMWDPPGPPDWMLARKTWAAYVRRRIANNQKNLDTELFVINEQRYLEAQGKPTHPSWRPWQDIKDTFEINTVPEWVDDFAVNYCAEWLTKHEHGICWVRNPDFGERLAKVSGYPYFGAGAQASREILDVTGPIIASINSHHRGKDMQDRYCDNLVAAPMTSGRLWEQLIGRTHRDGQFNDRATFDVLQYTPELRAAFSKACARAQYIYETIGAVQRLNYADITFDLEIG